MSTTALALPRPPAGRRAGLVGLAILLPIVLVTTLWPTHFLLRAKPAVVDALGRLHDRGALEWLTWVRLEVLANVAMLVPVALLLTLVLGARRWWIAALAGAAFSVAVELVQWTMPHRVASLLDIVANTAGAVVGALLGATIAALLGARRRRASVGSLAAR